MEESLDHIMGGCSMSKLVSSLMSRWVHWWPQNISSAHSIWTTICDDDREKKGRRKEVKKVIGAAFFWTMWRARNGKVFNGEMVREKVIFENIQFLAFDWIRNRFKFGKLLAWDFWICNPLSAIDLCTSLASR